MDLNKLGKRAYKSALKRGKISESIDPEVSNKEMCNGVGNEYAELVESGELLHSDHLPKYSEVVEELADIALVTMTELYRRGIDIEELLHAKMKFNETRKD